MDDKLRENDDTNMGNSWENQSVLFPNSIPDSNISNGIDDAQRTNQEASLLINPLEEENSVESSTSMPNVDTYMDKSDATPFPKEETNPVSPNIVDPVQNGVENPFEEGTSYNEMPIDTQSSYGTAAVENSNIPFGMESNNVESVLQDNTSMNMEESTQNAFAYDNEATPLETEPSFVYDEVQPTEPEIIPKKNAHDTYNNESGNKDGIKFMIILGIVMLIIIFALPYIYGYK